MCPILTYFRSVSIGHKIKENHMKKDFINWGIISCARIAEKSIIPSIMCSSNSKLHAISGKTEEKLEKLKEKFNPIKAYNNYEDMLTDPDIDVVYIPLPNSMHLEWVLKAAAHKKHILCEKPLACNSDEVLKMKDACEKNGVILMEAFAYRHNAVLQKVKELIQNGVIGNIRLIEAYFSFPLQNEHDFRLVKEMGGGATYDVGCYVINLIRYLAGVEPESTVASGEINPKTGVDLSSCGILDFGKNLKGMFYCAMNSNLRCGYRVVGDAGMIDIPQRLHAVGDLKISVIKDMGTEIITVNSHDNYALEVEHFGRCILEGEKPLISIDDSYNNMLVIDQVLSQILKK